MMRLDKLPNQRPDERVVLFLRRHWIAPFTIAAVTVLLLGVPAILALLFQTDLLIWLQRPALGPLTILVAVIYAMGIWLLTAIEFTDYYLDTWIVTTERVINIEQEGLFKRTASELHLGNIQDVTSEIKGFLETMLGYGDVLIQTAGKTERFNFERIPNPDQVKDTILHLVEEDKKRHAMEAVAKPAP